MEMIEWDILYDENASNDENVDALNCYLSSFVENICLLKVLSATQTLSPGLRKTKLLHKK